MNFVLAQTQLAYYLPAERLKGHCIGIVAQFKLILALNYFIYELLVFNKLGFLLNFLSSASRVCRDLFLKELNSFKIDALFFFSIIRAGLGRSFDFLVLAFRI